MASSTPSEPGPAPRRPRTWWSAAAVLLVLLAAGSAPAAGGAERRARALALEGKKAFDLGDYATAIDRYARAYQLKAAPGLLFNLGQSHRKRGERELAVSFFRRYLESNPPAAQARATEAVLAQLEAERVEQAARAAAEEAARKEAQERERLRQLEESRLALARSEAEAASRRLELELALKAPAPVVEPPLTQRWWFWTGLGALAAGGVTAAVLASQPPSPAATTFPDINAR